MQAQRCRLVRPFLSPEHQDLQVGQQLLVLEDSAHKQAWVKCQNPATGSVGYVPVSHTDIDPYEEYTDPPGDEEEADSADEDDYDDTYVPTEQRLFHCIRAYSSSDISVNEGELVVDVDGRWFKDEQQLKWRVVERRGLWRQQGKVPESCIEGVYALQEQPWFVGNASRGYAEAFLRRPDLLNETFLVRQSTRTEGYVISILQGNRVRHRKVHMTATGGYTVVPHTAWHCVVELVLNHQLHQPRGFKLHHAYNKYCREHAEVLKTLGLPKLYKKVVTAMANDWPGLPPPHNRLPPPDMGLPLPERTQRAGTDPGAISKRKGDGAGGAGPSNRKDEGEGKRSAGKRR